MVLLLLDVSFWELVIDCTTLLGEGRALFQMPFLFQVLATCSPILTRARLGKAQKELVKRYVLSLFKLTTPFRV